MDEAFRLLARRARSEAEIAGALAARGFSRSVVSAVGGRLRRLGYLGDRKLAADLAERLRDRGFGSLRIRVELERRGIAARTFSLEASEERSTARRALAERFGENDYSEPRRRLQAALFLAARGFSEETIESILDISSL